MAPASNDEQFKFLISCIRHSCNGKVDFEAVRMECDICSKGAAAKRYERMMKAHGIYQTNSTIADTSISSSKTKTASIPGTSNSTTPISSKKRKHAQFVETSTNTDDDEGLSKAKSEPLIKKIKCETLKEEPNNQQACRDTPDVQQLPVHPEAFTSIKEETSIKSATDLGDDDDSATFRDFLSFGAFGGQDADLGAMFDARTGLDDKPAKNVVPESKSVVPASIVITE